MAHKVIAKGKDSRGVGRWAWTKYGGANGKTFIVVTVYVPNKPSKVFEGSVYEQQVRAMAIGNEEPRCPREVLMEELASQIQQWKEEGNANVIIMGDWNTDVQGKKFKDWYGKLGLVDATANHVAPAVPPPTYDRGRKCIDAILATKEIIIKS